MGVVLRDRVRERWYLGAGPLVRERAVAAVVVIGLKKYRVLLALPIDRELCKLLYYRWMR